MTQKTYTVRPIGKQEIARLDGLDPDNVTEGWAVVELLDDDEFVLSWFADRHAAKAEIECLASDY